MKQDTTPNWHIAQQNLKISLYLGSVGGIAAVVLAVWVPFRPSYLGLAVALGAITFVIQWFGIRRRTHLGLLGMFLTMFTLMLVTKKFERTSQLILFQACAAWIFSY